MSKLQVASVTSRRFGMVGECGVDRNRHQVDAAGDARTLCADDRPEPAAERLWFTEIVPVKPGGQEGRLRGILGGGVIPQERVGIRDGGAVISPDEIETLSPGPGRHRALVVVVHRTHER
jgi:hypothetical protein